jgi:arylsulfatase
LIDIDTLRADRLAAYGASRETMPGIDAWAAQRAVVYTDSVSAAPWTLPSTVSFLTGLAVHQHGVDQASDALSSGAPTLASLLAAAGYETRGLAGGGYLRPDYGCDIGFERFEMREPKDLDWSAALDYVRTRDSERPFFLFLHTYFVHAPYGYDARWTDPAYDGVLRHIEVDTGTVFEPWHRGELDLGEDDGAYIEALYDGLVSRMDREVAEFLRALDELVPDGQLMVVFTSDHGEAFLEHGHLGHGVSLYDEQLRVPLLVAYPDGGPGTRDVPASGVDVVPTVLDSVGLPVPDGLAGRSLRDATGGAVRVAQSGDDLRAALSDGYKIIEHAGRPDAVELYALATDALELEDLSQKDAKRLAALRRRLEWFLGAHPVPEGGHAVDNVAGRAVLEELRALGYLGGGDD